MEVTGPGPGTQGAGGFPGRILAISPHTDDAELGAGGAMARWLREGRQVHLAAFSIAERSVAEGLPADVLLGESRESAAVLGVPAADLTTHRFEVRRFPESRQDILEALIGLREKLQPELVLLPASGDIHQDHQTIANEGLRAFKHTSILGYELPWNLRDFRPGVFVILEKEDVDRKVAAVQCYRSQASRPYCDSDFIYGLARVRGVQAQTRHAEAFECVRWFWR